MRFEDALLHALHFSKVWGVRCSVYGYKRSNRWHYQYHPTFKSTQHLVLAAAEQAPKMLALGR